MALSTLVRGDHWKFTVTVADTSNLPIDVTGSAVWLTFKSKPNLGQLDSQAEFQLKNVSIAAGTGDDPENDPTNGIVILRAAYDGVATLPPDKTLIAVGSYNYDCQYKDLASGEITTINSGTVSVSEQVTEAVA